MENKFLERLEGKQILAFLQNGIKLTGTLTGFDEYTIYIEKDGLTQMVYKSSIATVMPYQAQKKDVNYNR